MHTRGPGALGRIHPGKVISQASSIRGWLQLPACRRPSFSCRAPKAGVGVENTSICASKGRARIEVSAQHDHGIYRRIPHVLNLRSELLN